MPDLLLDAPADAPARDAALDIRRSVIVQAPAGSGKTDLLTRRFLRLLAAVDEPEEILAITFTRAATAEMRSRILRDLEAAAGRRPFSPEELSRAVLAREALAHSGRRGWKLLEQPQRLAIETIDSLCLRIAHDRPLLAHLGGRLQPTEEAEPLYALAARRTLQHLGGPDLALSQSLAHLLDLRDNRLADCESLLAKMLAVRDQWLHAYPLSREMTEDDWLEARLRLEAPFQRENRRVLSEAWRLLDAEPLLCETLLELAQYASANGNEGVGLLAGLGALSASMPLEHWRCICDFLLTSQGDWRRAVDKRNGFPSEKTGPAAKRAKDRMAFLLGRLRQMPQFHAALCAILDLPPAAYSDSQWTTLRHILTVLRQAIAELKIVFAEQDAVDFTEVSLAALEVLHHAPERQNIRHLLIDEFQDTSRRQHDLVSALLAAWDPGDRGTVFLVGDPMQSIYMFRQAEVELFSHVREHGIGPAENRIRCAPVQLSVNFRSHAGLTAPLNDIFTRISADTPPPGSAPVAFAPATSNQPAPPEDTLHIYPQLIGSPDRRPAQAEVLEAQQQEARRVLQILESQLPRIEHARAAGEDYRVAVLVRARAHLAQLVPLLRENRIPFRAVEIERLSERQELVDLLSLTRALLHPMDRVSWLGILRAPWCGLSLSDLHRLSGSDDPRFRNASVLELIGLHGHLLSADGRQRLARTAEILRRALELRWRQSESPSFASWIERAWRTLGGAACLDAAAYENTRVFFSLLDSIAPDGLAAFTGDLDAAFDRLFAQPDPSVSERCGIQLMTIHKAKGLGFEVVIVPGLDRTSSADPHPLVCSLERVSPYACGSQRPGETEFLVVPIGERGEETHPLYNWVLKRRKIRFDEERKRLFYVACTRARRELHLLGTAVVSRTGIGPGNSDSLLATAWPALRRDFETAAQSPQTTAPRVLAFPGKLDELAAAADPAPRLILRRLPLTAETLPAADNVTVSGSISAAQADPQEFLRPGGSRHARVVGSVVHTLFQRFGPDLATMPPPELRARAAAQLRASGLAGEPLASAIAAVTKMLLACAADPVCRWILAPHPAAQSEASWSGFTAGARLRTLRADRVFRAGPQPLAPGDDVFWIVDYKTSGAPSGALFLATERAQYEPQLLAYARALRALHGTDIPLRLGLYYPAISAFDYWDPDQHGLNQ